MRSEKELREFLKAIDEAGKVKGHDGLFRMTEKTGHWSDCIDWILEI